MTKRTFLGPLLLIMHGEPVAMGSDTNRLFLRLDQIRKGDERINDCMRGT